MGLFSKRQKLIESAEPVIPVAPSLTDEQRQAALARAQQTYASLGRMVSVMMRSPRYRDVSLDYIEGLASAALATGQFAIANAHDKQRGIAEPVALVMWTNVSKEVDQRLSKLGNKPMLLPAQDWRSGEIPWLLALVGDQRLAAPMLTTLQDKTFGGRELKVRLKEKNKVVVRAVSPAAVLPEQLAL